jgi:predicted Fe-S protein YdhL (DUF1289 family)
MTVPQRAWDSVPSPCISVCEMLPEAGVCGGCFRTLDEIAAWGALDDAEKRAVLAALPERRARWSRAARGSARQTREPG